MSLATPPEAGGTLDRVLLSREFTARSYVTGSTSIVVIGGEVDFEAVHRLATAIEAPPRSAPPLVVLDAADLTFIDSRGLGAIGSARNRLRAQSGDLVIRNASVALTRLLEIVGLTTMLETI